MLHQLKQMAHACKPTASGSSCSISHPLFLPLPLLLCADAYGGSLPLIRFNPCNKKAGYVCERAVPKP